MSTGGHDHWKEQLPGYLLGALSPAEKSDLEHHLGGCAECQSELRWLEPGTERLVEEVETVEASPELKVRVMEAVRADLAENPAPAPAGEQDLSGNRPSRSARGERRAERRPAGRGFDFGRLLRPAAVGAFAVVLFAGVITGYVVRGGGEESGPQVAQEFVAGHSTIGADAIMVRTGDAGTLKIANLEEPHQGQVYQAWVQRGQSVEATDSLFTPRRDGTATTSIPDLKGVDTVMVSAEPEGGSESPTSGPVITVNLTS